MVVVMMMMIHAKGAVTNEKNPSADTVDLVSETNCQQSQQRSLNVVDCDGNDYNAGAGVVAKVSGDDSDAPATI